MGVFWIRLIVLSNKKIKANYNFYSDGFDYVDYISSKSVEIGKWYTAITTYDGTKIKTYLDGEELGLNTDPNTYEIPIVDNIRVTGVPFTMGVNPGGKNSEGLTKVSGYSRVDYRYALIFDRALSPDEIADYGEEANPSNKDDLILYYNFKK